MKPIVGKSMEKVSLGTRDPAEARIRHAERLADLELRWAALRQGNAKLTHKQIIAIAGEFYRSLIDDHADEPGDPSTWQYRLFYDRAYFNPEQVKITKLGNWSIDPRLVIARRYDRPIRAFLIDRGLQVDEATFEKVRHEVRRALRQAHETLGRHAQGDYRPDPDAGRFPPAEIIKEALTPKEELMAKTRISITGTFEAYATETKNSPRTKKRWRPIMKALEAEVGDLQKITPDWCVAWKDRLLAQGLANKTVQEVYLASLRAVCKWAVRNRRIAANPLEGIGVKVKEKRRNRTSKGYTDAEAVLLLSATLQPAPDRMSPKNKAARRWVPWLCAYTGARVGEIAQMRKEDVFEKDGVWIMHVTPEAGTTKTGFPRDVPIH